MLQRHEYNQGRNGVRIWYACSKDMKVQWFQVHNIKSSTIQNCGPRITLLTLAATFYWMLICARHYARCCIGYLIWATQQSSEDFTHLQHEFNKWGNWGIAGLKSCMPTSKVPWAMPTSSVPAEMPSCATSPTMPREVPTQVQVTASAFIRIRKGWGQLTHLAPQLHLHLLFKAYHGYRRSFSTLQPAVCLWWFLTARGFLPEAAVLLSSGKTAEKTSQSFRWKSSSFSPGQHGRILSLPWVSLSPGQGFLPAGQLLLSLLFSNKLQFLCVMSKMFPFFQNCF